MTRDRWLERALIANFAVHGVALVAMAGLLIAVLPGGGHPDAERIAGIAAHPWQFRAGWLPWPLCAAADLALAIAMLRVRWLPRAPAIAVVPQDRALSSQPWRTCVSRQEIDLGIALDACTPMAGSVSSRAAAAIAGDAPPLCFHVAAVAFEFSAELHDPRPAGAGAGSGAGR